MSDYIKREDAIQWVKDTYCTLCKAEGRDYHGIKCRACQYDDQILDLESFPAAPVLEVVTCGECKHWKACGNGCQGWCESTGMFSNICEGQLTMINWFCADGERADTEAKNPKID